MSTDKQEFDRVGTAMREYHSVFTFGSNRAGIHGAGAAKTANELYGAMWGCGEGRIGRTYAIPTKDHNVMSTLPLVCIEKSIRRFLEHAQFDPNSRLIVTAFGTGFAGYRDEQMAELFPKQIPENVELPYKWELYRLRKKYGII